MTTTEMELLQAAIDIASIAAFSSAADTDTVAVTLGELRRLNKAIIAHVNAGKDPSDQVQQIARIIAEELKGCSS
jgi:hypothetical protein